MKIICLFAEISTVLFLLKNDSWLIIVIVAVIISQILIFKVWKDSKSYLKFKISEKKII